LYSVRLSGWLWCPPKGFYSTGYGHSSSRDEAA